MNSPTVHLPFPPPVVVGVDGSPGSTLAVRWAAEDAALRQRDLYLVHAFEWPNLAYAPPLDLPLVYRSEIREAAELMLDDAAAQARSVAPALRIRTATATEPAVPALAALSRHAAEVVVGGRGRGGFTDLLVGATGAQLAAHAVGPVVIVRYRGPAAGANTNRVVVGVDGSPLADSTLAFAFEQAALRNVGLTALHAYRWPATGDPGDLRPLLYDRDELRDGALLLLAEAIAGWREKYPDVDVCLDAVEGRPGAVLARESAGAQLLVVGARGHGGFTALLLGSVSQAAIHHAPCPVAVVHPQKH
ncbi:universal stress protein [Dactylosporangium matsuzakiense]|uniref:Universal stress protein n=2 Tax=Dactylosporangium matsuzakiense TaxID=53360 RepID=A0A9W6KU07_9ACTN|nr:universal stress protein [Dactylosporangium matsuzakiense]